MAGLAGRTETDQGRLTHAFDAGLLSGSLPADTPSTADADDDDDDDEEPFLEPSPPDSSTEDSISDSNRWGDLAASIHVFAGTLLRMEVEEMEVVKAWEASRMESEKRRVELELEMTQMLLKIQLQVASFISQKNRNRKRKRKRVEEEDDNSTWEREAVLLLGLLQCNQGF
ncbi:uncharacterized protein At4g22160 [Macadamia integrifolia]|uniref:uncharacterized protein At4g22160 n=1 Tax=Macadamia integrifolia TaxID=60698 RepID=UPI001C532324|nr:uncharacterized protein At4g22160 [Macadamia integrifolia]